MVEVADFNCSDPDFLDHPCGIMPWNDLKSREVALPEKFTCPVDVIRRSASRRADVRQQVILGAVVTANWNDFS